jgi:HAD superfamily hydrolase (TIGR01549 family)
VLFDLDDTLCDYAAARALRLRRAFCGGDDPTAHDHLGLDLDRMIAQSIARNPHGTDHFLQLFADLGIVDPASAHRAANWYQANRFFGLALVPEAEEVIAQIRGECRGATRIGIVTNGPALIQREKVDRLGIERLVDFVLVSGEFGVEKPGPGIFEEALRLGGTEANKAIMVGDSLDCDIAGAHSLGITSVWVNPRGRALLPSEPEPDHVIHRLAEFPDLLRRYGCAAVGC